MLKKKSIKTITTEFTKVLHKGHKGLIKYNPLSYFPQGGNDDFSVIPNLTPSPLGEGWEGGIWEWKRNVVKYNVPLHHAPCTMHHALIETSDGSHTIYVPELDEHYHSIHGAVQESSFIFILNGFDISKADPLNILEIGFGTGLNALLTAIHGLTGKRNIFYTTLEKYPLGNEIIESLNHHSFAGPEGKEIFNLIHASQWNAMVNICPNFNIKKIRTDFTKNKPEGIFDLIYFDAFGPDKQPEMWTPEMFSSIADVTGKNGILVTYSAKGEVKRNLIACGFDVSLLPGPPGKRQMIRAVKN